MHSNNNNNNRGRNRGRRGLSNIYIHGGMHSIIVIVMAKRLTSIRGSAVGKSKLNNNSILGLI